MSAPYDHSVNILSLDQIDQGYTAYDSHYGAFQRMSVPPTPYNGYAFWYRPEPQETIYHQDTSLFSRGMPIQGPAMTETNSNAIKHRRTRSGCFTCRSRRVKCDETRPICDRCRKGNRECEFPQSTSSSKRAKTGDDQATLVDAVAEKDDSKLETIKDESEEEDEEEEEEHRAPPKSATKSHRPSLTRMRTQSLQGSTRSTKQKHHSDASINVQEKVSTPSTEASGRETPLPAPGTGPKSPPQRWEQLKPGLKPEMRMYLRFQYEHMTQYHYLFKLDPSDFIHTELIDLALQFEPLLYAVVAFAAYHYTLRLPESETDFNSFWKYYCKSIVKLRKWLEANDDRNDLVLLTILQLAIFEEFLGDWTNLAAHHRAAYGILTTTYTPQSIMETSRGRRILDWYTHFDIVSALMAVRDTVLDNSWLSYYLEWYEAQAKSSEAHSTEDMIAYFGAQIRLTGRDVAHLFASANATQARIEEGHHLEFSIDNILTQVDEVSGRLDKLRCEIQELHHPSMTAMDEIVQSDDDDVFPSVIPLFGGALWPLNFVWSDWYGLVAMLKYQTYMTVQKSHMLQAQNLDSSRVDQSWQERLNLPGELGDYAQIQCFIYSAIKRSPTAPEGAILGCHASLGLGVVLLPKTPRYTIWARKQMAHFERLGYIWPPSIRKQMSQLWGLPEVEEWWLTNGEGKTRLLDEIRMIVEDRIRAVSEERERTGRDDGKSDLREIKGLFEKMSVVRRSSTDMSMDPAYINSTAGIMNAASMVSTPGSSSTGSATGFSPRASIAERDTSKRKNGSRRQSRASISGSVVESPIMLSKPAPGSRMSGIWEEQR